MKIIMLVCLVGMFISLLVIKMEKVVVEKGFEVKIFVVVEVEVVNYLDEIDVLLFGL